MPTNGKQPITKTKLRAALSRSKRHLLNDVDHRSPEMRRLRDLLHLHVSDKGGPDNISHTERVLIGRASTLTLLSEMQEQAFAKQNFENIAHSALTEYLRTINSLRRYCETLGLQRRARDVTNGITLRDLIAADQTDHDSDGQEDRDDEGSGGEQLGVSG
jgi:hypothetical protein